MNISEACVKGGIKGIEITFTVQGADKIISELVAVYQNDSKSLSEQVQF